MYLEKIEAQGFKSFANKNILKFPGLIKDGQYGITAIVGPNGSGKSNIADAVRWVLGEQSMKTLRGKKSEDVIFSGSDKKGKLGMAEVSLFLNNKDKKAPIDYSEVVLTRRLYRDGDSEYLINNSRVRLTDIQMLLAKASFGQKTYSVIGQGMVEGFLNTTLAERKEFFDEATGVKQFQIKRDTSLNKLKSSHENLTQVSMLLGEIEPRLRSLTKQVNKLEKREGLEKELKELQLKYYRKVWHEINDKFNQYNDRFLVLEKERHEKEKKLNQFNKELEKMESGDSKNEKLAILQDKSFSIQRKKDDINRQLARLDAELEMKLEAEGKFDLSWLNNKKSELKKEHKEQIEKAENLKQEISQLQKKQDQAQSNVNNITKELEQANALFNQLNVDNFKKEEVNIEKVLDEYLGKLKKIEQDDDLALIKKTINKIRQEIKDLLKKLSGKKSDEKQAEIKNAQEKVFEITNKKESLTKINYEVSFEISSRKERQRLLEEKTRQLENELTTVREKIQKSQTKFDASEIEGKKKTLKKELEVQEVEHKEINQELNKLNASEEEERAKLFALQKNVQAVQDELNVLNSQLGEIKVNSTRFETRLEDLEQEIRFSLGTLKDVKAERVNDFHDTEGAQIKIRQIKNQLEQIGGIDPEVEKEHKETKERYDFLSGQVEDLTGAIKSLEEIIKELDVNIKEKFDKEFKIIAKKFEEYFKVLFNGGHAKISKVMEEKNDEKETEEKVEDFNLAQQKKIKFLKKHNATGLAGIEVHATPPGKKIRSISMLSGGERALTAIALICAIISANPSPFVVLDEVDAALDEANSERLAKILDDLSQKTQFVVITHNRAPMRKANILYGVTMGDDGISKLLSVKLEDVNVD